MNVIELSRSRTRSLLPEVAHGQEYDLQEVLQEAFKKSLLGNKYADFEWLRIDADCFGDVGALAKLVNLKRLEITGCNPSQIEKVFQLETLRELNLNECSTDTGAFATARLPNLVSLDLHSCALGDLRGLEKFCALKALRITECSASDHVFQGLSSISGLQKLEIGECPISTLEPFRNCSELEVIRLDWSGLTNLTSVTEFRKLRVLSLGGTRTKDLTPITSLKKLERLNLSGNTPDDLEPLSRAIALKELNLSFAEVPDLTPLVDHPSLQYLDLSWAKSMDTTPLLHATRPIQVRVVGKQISWLQKRRLRRAKIKLIEDRYL